MSAAEPNRETDFFSHGDPSSCRIETQGGTVYWISETDDDGVRWVVREHLQSSDTNTMVMRKCSANQGSHPDHSDLGDKFRGRLGEEIRVGQPLVLEVLRSQTRIVSETVVAIEVGNVPAMIFG